MSFRTMSLKLFSVVLLAWGCSRPSVSAPVDAGASRTQAGSATVAPTLELTLSAEPVDAKPWSVRLVPGERVTIEQAGSLTLHTNLPLRNYRVRIFDDADRVLESDDQEIRSSPGGMDYLMALASPMLAGHRYALVLDPQTPGSMLDSTGRTFDELRFELQMAGERAKPLSNPGRHRKHKHRP